MLKLYLSGTYISVQKVLSIFGRHQKNSNNRISNVNAFRGTSDPVLIKLECHAYPIKIGSKVEIKKLKATK